MKKFMDDIIEINKKTLLFEIDKALQNIQYGSLEIIVQDGVVTQITVRKIQKTNLGVSKSVQATRTSSKNGKAIASKLNIKLRS